MIGLRLVDPISKIEKDMKVALINDLNLYLNKRKDKVASRIKESSRFWLLSQPEIQSLKDTSIQNSLSSLFGIPVGNEGGITETIVNSVINSIQVKFSKIDKNFRGSLTFSMQPSDFQNLLGLSAGHVTTEKGADLHWLKWLLVEGDSVVVSGYQYDASAIGRSGVGGMVRGGSFRVPPQYSGTISNNFVTRAFAGKQSEIEKILSEVLK